MAIRVWRRVLVLLVATITAIAALGVVVVVRIVSSRQLRELRAEIHAIRARGEPIEPADLADRCPRSDQEKRRASEWTHLVTLAASADTYTDEMKSLPFVGELEVKDDALDQPDAHELRQKTRAFLAKHEAALNMAHQLSGSLGPVAFPYKYEDGFDSQFPWVVSLRALNRLLAMQGRLRAVEGDVSGTVASWNAMLSLSEALRPRTCSVSCGVVEAMRNSMLRLAIEQVQFQINKLELSDDQLRNLELRLADIKPESDIRSALMGERIIGLIAFQHLDQLFGSEAPKLSPEQSLRAYSDDCTFFLNITEALISKCDLPYAQYRREAKNQLDAAIESARPVYAGQIPRFPGSALMLPGVVILSIESSASTIALRNIAIAAVASRRFNNQEKRFPDNLLDLVPRYLESVPIDPYTGNVLMSKRSEEDFTIYSAGKNETDDGGTYDIDTGDVSWIVKLK